MTTTTDPRLLKPGTATKFGVLDRQTMTGWFTKAGAFVPFRDLAESAPVVPLVAGITPEMVATAAAMAPFNGVPS